MTENIQKNDSMKNPDRVALKQDLKKEQKGRIGNWLGVAALGGIAAYVTGVLGYGMAAGAIAGATDIKATLALVLLANFSCFSGIFKLGELIRDKGEKIRSIKNELTQNRSKEKSAENSHSATTEKTSMKTKIKSLQQSFEKQDKNQKTQTTEQHRPAVNTNVNMRALAKKQKGYD